MSGNTRFLLRQRSRRAAPRQPLLYDQYGRRHGADGAEPDQRRHRAEAAERRRRQLRLSSEWQRRQRHLRRRAGAGVSPVPRQQVPGRSEPSLHHIACGVQPVCGAELGWRGRGVLRAGELIRGLCVRKLHPVTAQWRKPHSCWAKRGKRLMSTSGVLWRPTHADAI